MEGNFYRVPRGHGSVVEELPSNQLSTPFGVYVDDGFKYVDLIFGRIGTWELPQEGRNHEARPEQLVAVSNNSTTTTPSDFIVSPSVSAHSAQVWFVNPLQALRSASLNRSKHPASLLYRMRQTVVLR